MKMLKINLNHLYLFAFIFCFTSCGNNSNNSENESKEPTLENKLATIDNGGFVKDNDLVLKRYESVLNVLITKHPETKTQIGDMTYKGKLLLQESGINESIIDIMEGLARVNVDKGMEYSLLVTDYVTFRKKGVGKEEIINDFNKIMNSLK